MTSTPALTVRDALARAAATLPGEQARVEAELLLLHVLQQPRSWLFAHATDPVAPAIKETLDVLCARRAAGEPVAYLTGSRGFWTLELEVDPATLIPRPETELLVELALQRLPVETALRVADLGTGSGAIALALASERPQAQLLATDASRAALAVAARNAARHHLHNVRFAEGGQDWYAPLQGERFDLIASNPPYIATDDSHLGQGDLRFEPVTALASGPDGLEDIRRIVAGAGAHLLAEGWLLIEHGWDQGDAIRALFGHAGFAGVQTVQDLEQRDRVTLGQRPA